MASWEKFSRIVAEAKAAKKLDPVGHEDDDVDNDGDSDSSDSYLKKRRATVGAAIAADKKKKVEEAKQLDPVGKEDDDIDNDGDSDRTDSYLRNRRKVRSKIIQTKEEVEQIDEIAPLIAGGLALGGALAAGGAIKKAQDAAKSGVNAANRGQNIKNPGTGIAGAAYGMQRRNNALRDAMKQLNQSYQPEGEQIDEFFFGPSKVTPKGGQLSGSKAPVEVDKKYTAQKQGQLVNVQYDKGGNRKVTPMSNMERGVAALKLRQSGGGASSLSMNQYQTNSYQSEGELVDEGKADKKLPEHKRSAARLARYDNPSGALALGGGQQRARRAEHEERRGVKKEEFVGENKEHDREMRKAAARERAEERREKGSKAAKSPGREGPSAGKSYADYQEISIKAHDKLTKKNKNVVGLVAKEGIELQEKGMSKDEMSDVLKGHRYSKKELLDMSKKSTKEGRHGEAAAFYHEFQKEEVEQLDEMPYQVYGSHDGKKEKKVGKPVKSKRYAHDRAEELADTHKETGGKYRVQKEENEIDEGMSMKDFKANRKKNERREASADARKRGHEGKTWADSGRTYSADEAKSRREKMSDLDRSQRYRVANDPDSEHDDYPSDKTKSPKKLRKQKAMGELGEGYIEEKALSRAQQRFMGMVYAAKKGETPASPEVAKAAEGMSKKAAKDFAKTKHEGLPEKKVSEAVEPGGGGRAPTLPASEKFIDELPQKLGQLFNKFNAGKKTKQPPVKEELSLVERILDEAIKGTIAGGTSRAKKYKVQAKDVRIKQIGSAALSGDKKQVKRLKKANENPTRKITERGEVEGKKSEEERKDAAKKNVKRGKSDPSALARRATIAGAARLKAEKEKTKRQRERQQYEKERRAEKKADKAAERTRKLKSTERERIRKSEEREQSKREHEIESKRNRLKQAGDPFPKMQNIHYKEKTSSGYTKSISNAAGFGVGVGRIAGRVVKKALLDRQAKKESKKGEEMRKRHSNERMNEQLSNWREEFILEVDDQTVQNEKQKVIDVSKKKNKIEINPNMSEGCGCDEKKEETPKKDMRGLSTKINLEKTKMRSAGVRNPVVMVATEEMEQIDEIAPAIAGIAARLAPLLARGAGATATRGAATAATRGAAAETAATSATGNTLRSKAFDLLKKQGLKSVTKNTLSGDETSSENGSKETQSTQTGSGPQLDDISSREPLGSSYAKMFSNVGKGISSVVTKEDWQSVNRKDKTDGLSQKAVDAYRRENPGSKLQTAVTEKKPTGKRAARRKSFCSRMNGMKDRLTSAETARDPDSRINKALRRWNCN